MLKNKLALSAALVLGAFSTNSFASDEIRLPCGTAKLIVPWGAGGGTDIIFRTIVEEANAQGIKPQLQVVNMPGRSGNKGSKKFLKTRKNGCELLAIHQSVMTSYLGGQAKVNWDGYLPVAQLTETAEYIGVNGQQPYSTLAELQTYAKANPNTVVAAGSLGSTSHYTMLMLEEALNVKFRHVSYDGTRERTTALLSGNAHIGLSNLTSSRKNVETGAIKLLATTSEDRQKQMPDVPSVMEQGFDVEFGVRRGVALPKGTSPEIVAYYEEVFAKAVASTKVKETLRIKGTEVKYLASNDYSQSLGQEFGSWEALAKQVGIYNVK
ncbi:tripartite tricarboxylate transporter substrate binding protein [Vibrio sp. SS-MA-C1-2]|uniref:Bug family tripartite tricarboxylate transporter substrate binding protein n=1 Tax=Vibrio sp. SS-MA-C1-2 TaxID=2908646 RepID=UPI001F295394|nr:tripartite tricarboxylate transporter substrate binding protein [Vibrio sp. SS-MA-C1-2]UJF17900.1 tripartite tricarboxylate transporter substrate binding protein [Vibrio sp. SS-MA-C1-2]